MYDFDVYTMYKLMGIVGNMTQTIYFRNNLTMQQTNLMAMQLVMTDVYNCLQFHNTIHYIDSIHKPFESSFHHNETAAIIIHAKVPSSEKVKRNINSAFINNCLAYKFWYE